MRKASRNRRRPTSFTLIELLAVIAIIAILCGLTLAAYSGVAKNAARARARSEISALASVLEQYKVDNGTYPTPPSPFFTSTNTYTASEPNTSGSYQDSSAFLYQQLTGQTNFGDPPPTANSGIKIYDTFTRSQLGPNNPTTGQQLYLQDPFGNSYGYYTSTNGSPNPPNNGAGFFDLWSTGGDTTGTTNSWINNWNG